MPDSQEDLGEDVRACDEELKHLFNYQDRLTNYQVKHIPKRWRYCGVQEALKPSRPTVRANAISKTISRVAGGFCFPATSPTEVAPVVLRGVGST
uniref:Uncharacterized protein n=1 Tax=Steinernema glaseri TaxID=37863 RepID=A0A1I7Y018_9BILA